MNIKYLLLASLALAIAGCCGSSSNECTAAPKKNIAVQMYSVRDDLKKDYDGTVKKLGEMGFTAVEAAGYGNGKFYGKTPAEFKKSIEDNGMVVLSTHVVKTLSPKELESGDFSESMKWWDECIAAHKAAGAKYIVMPWMPVPKTLKDLKTYCNYFNEVGKKCKEAGMLFGYHNHAHEYQKIEDKVMYDCLKTRIPTSCSSKWTYTGLQEATKRPWTTSRSIPSVSSSCTSRTNANSAKAEWSDSTRFSTTPRKLVSNIPLSKSNATTSPR